MASGTVTSGGHLALPLDLTAPTAEMKLRTILDAAESHPHWFGLDSTAEERRLWAHQTITSPTNLTFEVWRGAEFVGILMLWRIVPKSDALLHFLFFDHNLVGKVRLLREFMRFCFDELKLQRLSIEVPDQPVAHGQASKRPIRGAAGTRPKNDKLISFARRKLSFRFEGETAVESHPLAVEITRNPRIRRKAENPIPWMASIGSRRERAHWRDGEWWDIVCLRLTAPEFREQFGE